MFGKKSKRISFKKACQELKTDAVELLRLAGVASIPPGKVWPDMSTKNYALLVPMAPGGVDIMLKKNLKEETKDATAVQLPKGAALLISKMKTRNFWGKHTISIQGLKKLIPKYRQTMDEIVEELIEMDWLCADETIKNNPPVALNPKFKTEMEDYMHAHLKNDK